MQKSAQGFTLVELLVVMLIMALTGIFVISNYRSFGEDQNLKNAVLDLQTQFRTAKTNATTNSECGTGQFSATWELEFASDKQTINLNCQLLPNSLVPKKTFKLDDKVTVQEIVGDASCPNILPFKITFEPLTGKMAIKDYPNCTLVVITLKNTADHFEYLNIEQGGRIYAQ